MILVVTGTRYADAAHREAIAFVLQSWDRPDAPTLRHGGARGVDEIAVKVARELGWQTATYPADWCRHGRGAGPIRNADMLRQPTPEMVLAFPARDAGGKGGTWDMIRRSVEAGVHVEIWPLDVATQHRVAPEVSRDQPA